VCLAVVALDAHPRYALVVVANRDEYHARPAAPVDWWEDVPNGGMLAGRDLEAGGTWLGVTRRGRWAFVTNVREPGRHDANAPSRGALVPRFLRNTGSIEPALADVLADAARYNGFNLLGGDIARAAWGSNRVDGVRRLSTGVHGVSNARLDTPWPKLERTKAGLSAWVADGRDDIASLFDLLADRARAPDPVLPSTGVSLDYERLLSSPFIVSPRYGTRCSTVLTITRTGAAHLVERAFDADGAPAGEVEHRFAINEASGP
jgi:uncharacterized protein with NRDE domain